MLIYKIISIYLFVHAGILFSVGVSLNKRGLKDEPATSIIISGVLIASALFAIAGSL